MHLIQSDNLSLLFKYTKYLNYNSEKNCGSKRTNYFHLFILSKCDKSKNTHIDTMKNITFRRYTFILVLHH